MELLKIIAPVAGLIFILGMGIVYVISANKDGKFTGDEMAKVIAMAGFVFMLIVNGYRPENAPLVFDHTMVMVSLGAVLVLAGIDIAKVKSIVNGDRGKDSTSSK